MCILEEYVSNILLYLTGNKSSDVTIIRTHSRKLEQLGELSFPLSIKNWYHLIDRNKISNVTDILQYNSSVGDLDARIVDLKEKCKDCQIVIESAVVKANDIHLYLRRSSSLYKSVISNVILESCKYGSSNIFNNKIVLSCDTQHTELLKMDLSTLRLSLLRDVSSNFIAFTTKVDLEKTTDIIFTLNTSQKNQTAVLCGPVLNDQGIKESKISAEELFNKRSLDMRLMAQHRYKVQVISNTPREEYFLKIVKMLGRACVTIEMLSNKPNKSLKVVLMDLRTANKGAAFIFYNCARLSVLLKEFERRVSSGIIPELPDAGVIDFSVLNQPEEWELFYVYILQFPILVKSCIKDIPRGIFNPQYLITYLSNLSSLFSAYYRRVRILTEPRKHLFGVLHARIYLLKSLQVVFYNSLSLLNIEPIKEM